MTKKWHSTCSAEAAAQAASAPQLQVTARPQGVEQSCGHGCECARAHRYHMQTHGIIMGGANRKVEAERLTKGVNILVARPSPSPACRVYRRTPPP